MLADQLADAVRDADQHERRRHDPVRERLDRVGEEHPPVRVLEAVELVEEDRDGALATGLLEGALDRVRRDRPDASSFESGSVVSSRRSPKPIACLVVVSPISPSTFRHRLEKSSLASQVAQALRTFAAPSSSAATSPSDVFPTPRSP